MEQYRLLAECLLPARMLDWFDLKTVRVEKKGDTEVIQVNGHCRFTFLGKTVDQSLSLTVQLGLTLVWNWLDEQWKFTAKVLAKVWGYEFSEHLFKEGVHITIVIHIS